MKRRQMVDIIAGRVNPDGTIAVGQGFRVAKVAVGIYDILFPPDFHIIAATASGHSTSYAPTVIPQEFSEGASFRVGINNTSNAAAADTSFSFVAVGYSI